MENIYNLPTVTLLESVALFKTPASYLVDTFFSNKLPTANSSWVSVEYKKGKRSLAPYIVKGAKAMTVDREGSYSNLYNAPMIGAKRIITSADLEMRMFGEEPIFSKLGPQERAAQLQAKDLVDLQNMIFNRRNKMAAEILTTGKVEVKGFADDGKTFIADEINFDFTNIITPSTLWNANNAKILDDLTDAVNKIAEESGELPDIMVCGANVEKYLLSNKQLQDMLLISNRSNLTIASLQPKYIAPQARYLGYINSLGLEVYSYLETYYDDETDSTQPFIPANSVIIGKAKKGRQIYGAITLVDKNVGVQTYSAEIVPKYTYSEEGNQISLSAYSRCILTPEETTSWAHIKTCG